MEKASVVSSGENELLWKSEPQTESIISVTLSRAVTSLLTARPNKLHDSISRLSSSHSPSPTASLHDSLRFFQTYVTDAVNHNRSFDQLLLPIIHSVIQSQSPPLFFFFNQFSFFVIPCLFDCIRSRWNVRTQSTVDKLLFCWTGFFKTSFFSYRLLKLLLVSLLEIMIVTCRLAGVYFLGVL